ncbi:phosphoribosylanthranilate isomerase [Cellvibrio zantedeschiae]|uniref:phosphoribosylanthranilate isomerase n=1 Tax=Cellvibrio zantedeschiae TaxID=1237077 RepID=UPI00167190B4|nr:phosphoribosylanthranilate isomerase [Cellvibrio zantedeschiae]
MRVKICGITSVADALVAVNAGADAIGLVFYAPSPRAVSIEQARAIAASVGPFVTVVGLFVNADESYVRQVLANVDLHVLQFHGDESREFCEQFQRPYMKAIRMRPDLDVVREISEHPRAAAILLDAYRPGVPGGTGETFDWDRVPNQSPRPIVLAGGLTAENVASAIRSTHVYGVDVSGGVESSPGKKDAHKVEQFIYNARNA